MPISGSSAAVVQRSLMKLDVLCGEVASPRRSLLFHSVPSTHHRLLFPHRAWPGTEIMPCHAPCNACCDASQLS